MQVTDTNHGGLTDAWLLRLNAKGQKIWDLMLGSGEEDILWSGVTLTDNSIVLVGHTNADSANGTVSQGNFGPLYTFDGWIVKVDNGGNILWDRRHGGGGGDAFAGIALAPDRGFWVTGALDSLGLYPTINDTIPRGGQDI